MLHLDIHYSRGDFQLDAKLDWQSQVLGVLGPSGAGKSTLLNLLNGLLTPKSGLIQFNQQILFSSQQKVCLTPHQRRIGMVFQDIRLFPHLNLLENLCYGLRLLPAEQRRFSLDEVLDLLQLRDLLKRHPHQLSGGEAQRVALGRALLMSPQLLLLDEPLSSLDNALKQQIIPYLLAIKQRMNLPMIIVSHDEQEVSQIADQLISLAQGKIIQH